MASLPQKLLLKPGQTASLVDAPRGHDALFAGTTLAAPGVADALVVYGVSQAALRKSLPRAIKALRAGARLWVCYPKGGQLGTDLSRDLLAKNLAAQGFESVRLVSLDDTWSAMMFLAR
jgi:hypothetical protein